MTGRGPEPRPGAWLGATGASGGAALAGVVPGSVGMTSEPNTSVNSLSLIGFCVPK